MYLYCISTVSLTISTSLDLTINQLTTAPSPHPCAGEIKRHPEVETLLVTGDSGAEVMKKVSNWLADGVN